MTSVSLRHCAQACVDMTCFISWELHCQHTSHGYSSSLQWQTPGLDGSTHWLTLVPHLSKETSLRFETTPSGTLALHGKTKIGDIRSYLSWREVTHSTSVYSLLVKTCHVALIQLEDWEMWRSKCRAKKQNCLCHKRGSKLNGFKKLRLMKANLHLKPVKCTWRMSLMKMSPNISFWNGGTHHSQ